MEHSQKSPVLLGMTLCLLLSGCGASPEAGAGAEEPASAADENTAATALLEYGDAVFFERGSVWRGVSLPRPCGQRG